MSRETSEFRAIPRRILISDLSDISGSYSSTPGGTIYSTTPGGTKIVYERTFLMNLRNSPISKTAPNWEIPNQIVKGSPTIWKNEKNLTPRKNGIGNNRDKGLLEDDEQFHLDM